MTEIHSKIEMEPGLVPLIRTADVDGATLDRSLSGGTAVGAVEVLFLIGARVDTWDGSNYIELQLEESDDDSTWTAVADADIVGDTETGSATGTIKILDAATDGSQMYRCGYKGMKRYVRGKYEYTGTHSTGVSNAIAYICADAGRRPTNNP